jgi:hypothetical protein
MWLVARRALPTLAGHLHRLPCDAPCASACPLSCEEARRDGLCTCPRRCGGHGWYPRCSVRGIATRFPTLVQIKARYTPLPPNRHTARCLRSLAFLSRSSSGLVKLFSARLSTFLRQRTSPGSSTGLTLRRGLRQSRRPRRPAPLRHLLLPPRVHHQAQRGG